MTIDYHDFTNIDTPLAERRKLGVGDTWINAVECTECGDVVRSKNRHDFVTCSCGSVSLDGGSWYGRLVGDLSKMINRIIMFNDVN